MRQGQTPGSSGPVPTPWTSACRMGQQGGVSGEEFCFNSRATGTGLPASLSPHHPETRRNPGKVAAWLWVTGSSEQPGRRKRRRGEATHPSQLTVRIQHPQDAGTRGRAWQAWLEEFRRRVRSECTPPGKPHDSEKPRRRHTRPQSVGGLRPGPGRQQHGACRHGEQGGPLAHVHPCCPEVPSPAASPTRRGGAAESPRAARTPTAEGLYGLQFI